MEWNGFDWRASEVGARRKTKQNPAMVEPVEIPDAEHELVVERAAAIDVAKATGKVCVRLPGKSGRRFSRVWDVPARTGAITELAEQLVKLGIDKVTVESTSDYWRIWYYLLEDAGLDVQLVNSRDVKNVPGRPNTDKLDAVWLAKLTEKGLLRPSFVPPAPIRVLRDYTRLREDLIRECTRYWQRLEKLLEDAAIKVSAVASKLNTLSTRDMIAGERDPRRLADLARGRMKAKRSDLITALDGRFDDHHGALSRYLKYVVAQLIVELWRWISVGALVFQAAASSAVTSRQTAKRSSISVRHWVALSRCLRGRKCAEMALKADRNRWACRTDLKRFIARSRCRVR